MLGGFIMSKIPEGGKVGTAQAKSYTFIFQQIANVLLGLFVFWDILFQEAKYLRLAIGLPVGIQFKIIIALWYACIIGVIPFLPFFGPGRLASVISPIYTQYTGTVYVQDRIGYAKSGANDIIFWCYYIPLITTLFLFIQIIPAGVFSIFRPFVITIIPPVISHILVRVFARIVFSALYGKPQFKWLVHPTNEEEKRKHDERWQELMIELANKDEEQKNKKRFF